MRVQYGVVLHIYASSHSLFLTTRELYHNTINCNDEAEYLVVNGGFRIYFLEKALRFIPSQYHKTENLEHSLLDTIKVMEEKCQSHLDEYKKKEIKWIAGEIKSLVGIDINQDF